MSAPSGKERAWGRLAWLGIGAGALVVVAGTATLVLLVVGRPRVSLSSSRQGLAQVRLAGVATKLSSVRATSRGRPVTLRHRGNALVPVGQLPQGRPVRITVRATSPAWLRWLVGPGVTATRVVRTPTARPSSQVAVVREPGRVPVRFDRPVSVVEFTIAGAPPRIVHLRPPAAVADLAVPSSEVAGALRVAAAPLPWETFARTRPVSWLVAAIGGAPVALARPAPGSATATTNGRITLTFAEPVATALGGARPTVVPDVAGTWTTPTPDKLVFTPKGFGFGPGTAVTVRFDRPVAVEGAAAARTVVTSAAASTTYRFHVAPGSLVRVEQLLAQLHYLPLKFVPAPGVRVPTTLARELATISHPLEGRFSWRWASVPAALQAQWTPGSANLMLKGALMAFDAATRPSYDGYALDDETVAQLADASLWRSLLEAAAADKVDPSPYAYVSVTEASPETLTLWENGRMVLTSLTNTGISQDPTVTGTYPIYVRYALNYMSGTNPDGTAYHDLVPWINYFNGGDAVHGFVRSSYGFPQSLGCVELPVATAAKAFSLLAIGDLVTVTG